MLRQLHQDVIPADLVSHPRQMRHGGITPRILLWSTDVPTKGPAHRLFSWFPISA